MPSAYLLCIMCSLDNFQSYKLQDEEMVEQVIDRLLDVRNGRPGKPVQLTEGQIRQLCLMAKEVFLAQPNLLELEAPIKICGKLAGFKGLHFRE